MYFPEIFLNLAVNPKSCLGLPLFTAWKLLESGSGYQSLPSFLQQTFFKQLLSWVVMISLMRCISSFTPWSHYALRKNSWKNVYCGICMSFVKADAGLLGNSLSPAIPQLPPTGPPLTRDSQDPLRLRESLWTPTVVREGRIQGCCLPTKRFFDAFQR